MTYVKRYGLIFLASTLLLSQISFAAVIRVPQDQPTIQAGIDAASDGDTVLVNDGIWTGTGNMNLRFKGKAIGVQSENGPQACIIDCNYSGRGVIFENGETNASILQGFTIRNGKVENYENGGAIQCINSSSPSIMSCIFENNSARMLAGGIYCEDNSSLIMNCVFENNSATYGGGIYCKNSNPSIMNCVFENNSATNGPGGAIYISNFSEHSNQLIFDCAFIGNTAKGEGSGGGIHASGSQLLVLNCAFIGNSANGSGGGIYSSSSSTIFNCLFDGNSSIRGGGVYYRNQYDVMTIINSSIVNNTSSEGGGLYAGNHSTLSILNSILWGNKAPFGDEVFLYESTLNISYCNVENGISEIHYYYNSTCNWGDGMMDSNPKFVSGPGGNFYLSHTATGQSSNSPCVDAGSDLAKLICESFAGTNYCMNDYTTRTDGVNDLGQVDMGYHYNSNVSECDYLGSRLVISQVDPFRAGDTFWLKCHVCNNTYAPMPQIATAVLLGVYGEFFFWPGWTQNFDLKYHNYEPGLTEIQVFEPFIWPSIEGHAEGLEFYSGLINAGMTGLIGDFGYLTFGYTDR